MRTSEASTLSGSRRREASANRIAESWAPADSACRESAANVAASPRITPRANSNPSLPKRGRNTPSLARALRKSSSRKAFSERAVAVGISSAISSMPDAGAGVAVSTARLSARCISRRPPSRGPSINTIESRSPRSGGSLAGSIRNPAPATSLESITFSGHVTGTMANEPITLPASLAETVSSGTISIPPVALAMAARHGQLTSLPIPTLENGIRFDRSTSRAC